MVHFDNYENDDEIPIELLSTLLDLQQQGQEHGQGPGPGQGEGSENRGHASSKAGRQECR